MQYILSLPLEVEAARRQRRAELRHQRRQQVLPTIRKVETVPIVPALLGGARSVMSGPERRIKLIRPVRSKPRPESRTAARPLVATRKSESSGAVRILRRLEEVAELLDVADLVPDRVDHEHVRAIIVWGCLNPGQRGKTMMLGKYITEQNVRKKVYDKLGRDYNPEAFERALAWLRRVRVVISDHKRKRHQSVVALNPHVAAGRDEGPEVIRRVLATKDAIAELTTA